VLVIDDDPVARDLIQRTLVREGFRVTTASGGREGCALARELHPSAITLDVLMPEQDGWTTLSALKQDPATAGIPVVMVTVVDDRMPGLTLGAADHLSKPLDREKLTAVLRRHLAEAGDTSKTAVLVMSDDPATREQLAPEIRRAMESDSKM
jgi:DNA-binding response OmpR family regulator